MTTQPSPSAACEGWCEVAGSQTACELGAGHEYEHEGTHEIEVFDAAGSGTLTTFLVWWGDDGHAFVGSDKAVNTRQHRGEDAMSAFTKHPATCPWSVGEARCTCGLVNVQATPEGVARVATQWRKKPVIIDAAQWDGTPEGATPLIDWMFGAGERSARFHNGVDDLCIKIDTLEGTIRASPGDWIIRGVQGEFYPCKPDIFEATYEPA